MEELDAIEWFGKYWEKRPVEQVFEEIRGKSRAFVLLYEIGAVRVMLAIIIGPRGGLTEELMAVDTSEPIMVDQLVVNRVSYDSGVTDLIRLQETAAEDRGVEECARSCLEDAAISALRDPDGHIKTLKLLQQSTGESVSSWQGGAPGLVQQKKR